jgi:hypothetical protein
MRVIGAEFTRPEWSAIARSKGLKPGQDLTAG